MDDYLTLTAAGAAWARDHSADSLSARLALGLGTGWPASHIAAAVKMCNDRGRETHEREAAADRARAASAIRASVER